MRDQLEYGNYEEARALSETILAAFPDAVEAKGVQWWLTLKDGSFDIAVVEAELLEWAQRTPSWIPYFLVAELHYVAGDVGLAQTMGRYLVRTVDDGIVIRYLESWEDEDE